MTNDNDGAIVFFAIASVFAIFFFIGAVGVGIEDLTRKISNRSKLEHEKFVNEYDVAHINEFAENVYFLGRTTKYHKYLGSFLYRRRFIRKFKRHVAKGNKA